MQVTGDDRCSYRHGERAVRLRVNVSPSVVAHELVHPIEHDNPKIKKIMKTFRKDRTLGEQPVSLMLVTGDLRYREDEMTYEDQWEEKNGDPYCGKICESGVTELLTIAVQRIDLDPLEFYANDPEYFEKAVKVFRKWDK